MSLEHAPFIRAICETPGDDTPRLVFADWLDEHGEPERAEFIRVQCELVALDARNLTEYHSPGGVAESDLTAANKLRRRERELWVAYSSRWFTDLSPFFRYMQIGGDDPDEITVLNWKLPGEEMVPGPWAAVRRGFVAEITCTAAAFVGGECGRCGGTGDEGTPRIPGDPLLCRECKGERRTPGIAAELFAAHPVERVNFTDDPRDIDGQDGQWRRVLIAETGLTTWTNDRWPGVEFSWSEEVP